MQKPAKSAISERFKVVIESLKSRGDIASYADFARKIGTTPQILGDIRSGRIAPSLDHIYNTLHTYPYVSLDFVIKGEGGVFAENKTNTPPAKSESNRKNEFENEDSPLASKGFVPPTQPNFVPPTVPPTPEKCQFCEEKERVIFEKEQRISELKDTIALLKRINYQLEVQLEEATGKKRNAS